MDVIDVNRVNIRQAALDRALTILMKGEGKPTAQEAVEYAQTLADYLLPPPNKLTVPTLKVG